MRQPMSSLAATNRTGWTQLGNPYYLHASNLEATSVSISNDNSDDSHESDDDDDDDGDDITFNISLVT